MPCSATANDPLRGFSHPVVQVHKLFKTRIEGFSEPSYPSGAGFDFIDASMTCIRARRIPLVGIREGEMTMSAMAICATVIFAGLKCRTNRDRRAYPCAQVRDMDSRRQASRTV